MAGSNLEDAKIKKEDRARKMNDSSELKRVSSSVVVARKAIFPPSFAVLSGFISRAFDLQSLYQPACSSRRILEAKEIQQCEPGGEGRERKRRARE
jgi:hypothetical protein